MSSADSDLFVIFEMTATFETKLSRLFDGTRATKSALLMFLLEELMLLPEIFVLSIYPPSSFTFLSILETKESNSSVSAEILTFLIIFLLEFSIAPSSMLSTPSSTAASSSTASSYAPVP